MEIVTVPGSDLETRLTEMQAKQFEALIREYYGEVVSENPRLGELSPPYGIGDVREQTMALDSGQKPHYTDDYMIALAGNAVAGFLSMKGEGDILLETHLVVGKDFSGSGIGTALLQEFIKYGNAHGFREARIYNFTIGGYATFRKVEKAFPNLTFENLSVIRYGD